MDYPYVVHQRTRHGNVPLWVAVNAMTFGQVSRMYGCLKPSVKAAIAKQYEYVNERQLEQMTAVCVLYRNVCAHGERLFDHRVRVDVPDMPPHEGLSLPKKGNQYRYGKRDLFGVVVSLRYLLPEGEFSSFLNGLDSLLLSFSKSCKAVPYEELLCLMGFPINWQKVREVAVR